MTEDDTVALALTVLQEHTCEDGWEKEVRSAAVTLRGTIDEWRETCKTLHKLLMESRNESLINHMAEQIGKQRHLRLVRDEVIELEKRPVTHGELYENFKKILGPPCSFHDDEHWCILEKGHEGRHDLHSVWRTEDPEC